MQEMQILIGSQSVLHFVSQFILREQGGQILSHTVWDDETEQWYFSMMERCD